MCGPSGRRVLRILEQNYRADPVSLEALMRRYEGQSIEFQVRNGDKLETVTGKIVRPRRGAAHVDRMAYPNAYAMSQPSMMQALIEVAGKLRFDMPGVPLFPGLGAGMILKPTLDWTIETDRAGAVDAELAYVSGGSIGTRLQLVQGDSSALDIIGWVTMETAAARSSKTRA